MITQTPNSIECPVRPADVVTLPAGTVVRTMHPSRKQYTLTRSQKVTVDHTLNGWVDLWNDHKHGVGYVVLPSIRWPGTGGYWNTVKVTPELCEAWGIEVPTIPTVDERYTRLDTVPAYGVGYDNRDEAK